MRGLCCGLVFALQAGAAQEAEPSACTSVPAVVSRASATEFEIVCEAALAAARFLQAADARLPPRIRIDIVAEMPPGVPANAPGCFAQRAERVFLLQWAVFERGRDWLGVPPDLALYRSVVTHELAHAIAACQDRPQPLSRLAQEYLANVTMYATMQPALRDRLLAAHPGTGYEHEQQITILDYLADPPLFGADVYRHWTTHRDRVPFLRLVLQGRALIEQQRD